MKSRLFLGLMAAALAVFLKGQSPPGEPIGARKQGPTAHFTISTQGWNVNDGQSVTLAAPLNGTATATFTNTSTLGSAGITSYVWKTNGSTVCSSSPSCTVPFSIASNTITLTVTDANGQSSTASNQVNVTFQRSPTAHLSMTGQGQSKTDGQTLVLRAPSEGSATAEFTSTSTQTDTRITSYIWKNNGSPICSSSPLCSLRLTSELNTITLTVSDSNGQSSTATGQVTVASPK
jgi:hypothetical protein